MANIKDIEGIGASSAKILQEAGISTTDDLLDHAASKKDRDSLADKTGISEKLLLEWTNLADLFRINGIGEEFSDLLEEVGVDSVPELAQRNAANLHQALVELNESKNLVNRVPSLSQVAGFIEQAKSLDRVVTH